MRHCLFLTGLLLLVPTAGYAQVTINLRALDALPNTPPAVSAPLPVRRPAPRPVSPPAPESRTASTTLPPLPPRPVAPLLPTPPTPPVFPKPPTATPPAAPAAPATNAAALVAPPPTAPPATAASPAPATPAPPAATLPTAPPASVALAPIPPPPAPATTSPPPAPPVSAGAGTTATPEAGGLQLVFKPAESELSPDASTAIKRLVQATPTGDTISYNVVAYASGQADDPSVARRTSLARGLAVRGALIADGVPSTRIYVRALGSGGGAGPADRVEISVLGLSGAAVGAKP